ncbi:hypothetical protein Dda_9160 [Drechslerella dactyloides]|uniref:Extracellular serine-rich protein n=1 Tax=Drechslerella dactyloides TaxID=74499 RepID=A0AAD6IPK9_DREDA|nr:hypothetical protein Dda_9160 [Drechslerella dactyloides]
MNPVWPAASNWTLTPGVRSEICRRNVLAPRNVHSQTTHNMLSIIVLHSALQNNQASRPQVQAPARGSPPAIPRATAVDYIEYQTNLKMFFSKSLVALAPLAAVASAMTPTYGGATPANSVAVHVITAMSDAGGKPVFMPAEVQANVGDLIQFQFHPMNHSVVQASFADPCIPISQSAAGNGQTGFFSGFMPVAMNSNTMPTFTFQVNNTNPIWFYCSQGKHCQAGMVGAINPTANRTLADFKNRAATAPNNLSPGQAVPVGNGGSSSVVPALPPTPTTMQTTGTGAAPSVTGTGSAPPIQTGAAAKFGSSMPLLLAAVAASFFCL